jgi:hypothetical protein
MDKVQIYYATLLTLSVIASFLKDGELREGRHSFKFDFIAYMMSLPIVGRIFGWW